MTTQQQPSPAPHFIDVGSVAMPLRWHLWQAQRATHGGQQSAQPALGQSRLAQQPPPLLALHGFGGEGADFRWLAAAHTADFTLSAPDLTGHGLSDCPAERWRYGVGPTLNGIHAALAALAAGKAQSAELPDVQSACTQKEQTLQAIQATPAAQAVQTAQTVQTQQAAQLTQATPAAQTQQPTQAIQSPQYMQSMQQRRQIQQMHYGQAARHTPILLGYSMGGRVALRYLARYGTAAVRALVLIGASAGLADPAERRSRRNSDAALAAFIEKEGCAAFAEYWNRVPLIATQRHSPFFAELQQARLRNSPQGLANSLRGIGTGALAAVSTQHLQKIDIPCLIVSGANDEKFTVIGQKLAAILPQASHAVIPAAGHAAHLEAPEAFSQILRAWLAKTLGD